MRMMKTNVDDTEERVIALGIHRDGNASSTICHRSSNDACLSLILCLHLSLCVSLCMFVCLFVSFLFFLARSFTLAFAVASRMPYVSIRLSFFFCLFVSLTFFVSFVVYVCLCPCLPVQDLLLRVLLVSQSASYLPISFLPRSAWIQFQLLQWRMPSAGAFHQKVGGYIRKMEGL